MSRIIIGRLSLQLQPKDCRRTRIKLQSDLNRERRCCIFDICLFALCGFVPQGQTVKAKYCYILKCQRKNIYCKWPQMCVCVPLHPLPLCTEKADGGGGHQHNCHSPPTLPPQSGTLWLHVLHQSEIGVKGLPFWHNGGDPAVGADAKGRRGTSLQREHWKQLRGA